MQSLAVKVNFSLVLGLGAPKLHFDFGKVEGSQIQRGEGGELKDYGKSDLGVQAWLEP
jgi:hypothetical protein